MLSFTFRPLTAILWTCCHTWSVSPPKASSRRDSTCSVTRSHETHGPWNLTHPKVNPNRSSRLILGYPCLVREPQEETALPYRCVSYQEELDVNRGRGAWSRGCCADFNGGHWRVAYPLTSVGCRWVRMRVMALTLPDVWCLVDSAPCGVTRSGHANPLQPTLQEQQCDYNTNIIIDVCGSITSQPSGQWPRPTTISNTAASTHVAWICARGLRTFTGR